MVSTLEQLAAELSRSPSWAMIGRIIADLGHGTPQPHESDRVLVALERAARLLLSPAGNTDDFVFATEAFLLPQALAMRSGSLQERTYWEAKRRQMLGYLEHRLEDRSFGHVLASLLICESIIDNRAVALGAFMRRLSGGGAKQFQRGLPATRDAFFNLLVAGGWLTGDLSPAKAALVDIGRELEALSGAQVRSWVLAVMDMLFAARAPEPWLELLFTHVVLKVLAKSATQLDTALLETSWLLDFLVSRDYLRSAEGTERFARIMGGLSQAQRAVGASARKLEPGADVKAAAPTSGQGVVKVGFVVHSGARLAHTENLLTFLRGVRALESPGIVPLVFVATTGGDETATPLREALAPLDVPLRWPPPNAGHPIVWLRRAAEADNVAAMVFVSSPLFMGFAAGYRAAPALMWWAMKYHGLSIDGVDGYLTVGNFFDDTREIDGRSWRSTRMALPELRDPLAVAEAAQLREQAGVHADQVLYACIGREEKMLEWAYIDSVGSILEQCPGSRFVWTGRSTLISQVQALLEKRGIANRCACAGWLKNTKVLAEALDVYLDTFPFASGHTGYEAMAAGKPVLVLTTPEALESSTATSLVPAIRGEIGQPEDQAAVRAIFTEPQGQSLLPYVDTVADYVAWGRRLGHDSGFRRAVGAACQAFVERFARNERLCAETTVRHIREVVLGKMAGSGATSSIP